MDVRLPDGTIIKGVPDGTTKEQLASKLESNGVKIPSDWMPKAKWPSVIGNALMRGGSKTASGIAMGLGAIGVGQGEEALYAPQAGQVEGQGDTSRQDAMFRAADQINQQGGVYWQPKGRQTTAQKVVGGLTEPILPLVAGGGNPALFAATSAMNTGASDVRAGMNPTTAAEKAAIEGVGEYAAFAMPIKGVKQAVGSQVAIAAGTEGAKEAVLALHNDDPVAKKQAQEVLKQFLPNVGMSALSGLSGAALVKIIEKIPSAKAKLAEKMQKEPEVKPEDKPTPTRPPVPPSEVKASAFSDMPSLSGQQKKPVVTPEQKAQVEQEQERQAAEFDDWTGKEAIAPSADKPTPQPAPREAKNRVSEGVPRETPLLFHDQHGELAHLRVYFKGTGVQSIGKYAGAVIHDLNDFDRAAMALTGKKGESFAPRTFTIEQIAESFERAGVHPEEARAYGERLIAEIKRQHEQNVGMEGGKWNNPEGNLLPIYAHGRPVGKTAEHAVAEHSVQQIQEIVAKKKEPVVAEPEDITRVEEREALQEHLLNLDKLTNPGARSVAAVGLIAASESAKADDGSDTETSDYLLYAGLLFAGGTIFKARSEALKLVAKNPAMTHMEKPLVLRVEAGITDAFHMFGKKGKVVETGAKQIVDKWDKYIKMAARRIVQASHKINEAGTGKTAHDLANNKEFQANTEYIAQMIQEARWKDDSLQGMSIAAALEHWDEKDPATKEMIDAYYEAKNNITNTEDRDAILAQYPMFTYGESNVVGGNGLTASQCIEEGLRNGMKLKGDSAGAAFVNYASAAFNKVALGNQIRDLKKLTLNRTSIKGGEFVTRPAMSQTEPGYVPIGESWGGTLVDLEGWKIHPDLVNDFKLSFNTYKPGATGRTLQAINLAIKRAEVGFSGFHAMSLAQAKLNDVVGRTFAGTMPSADGAKAMMDEARRIYDNPDGSPTSVRLDMLLGEGLMVEGPLEAVKGKEELYQVLDGTGELLSTWGLGLEKATWAVKEADKAVQKFTWDYVHTNFKIMTALKEFEHQMAKHPEKSEEQIAKEVAEYTNDIFGSIDWRRIGYQFNSKFGRDRAAELFSGKGKFMMNLTLFAPDWFMSTSRAWLNALPRVSDGKIIWDDRKKLYARYLLGGATAYIAVGEALNYAMSGHDMLDNEPTKKNPKTIDKIRAVMMVDRGDGTSIQLSKHFTDFIDLMLEPGKISDNKMSTLISTEEALRHNKPYAQSEYKITYSEAPFYASPTGAKDAAEFLAKKVVPISAQAAFGDGDLESRLVRAGLGMAGMSERGYTADEKAAMKQKENDRRRAESE